MRKKNLSYMLALLCAGFVLFTTSCKDDSDVAVQSIALDQTSASIAANQTLTLNVVFTPTDATNKNIKWRSADAAVATVAAGVVTGQGVGETTITAISEFDSTFRASATIKVTAASVVEVTDTITSNTTWTADNIYRLNGFIKVRNCTLTIEPGTIIKGVYGTKAALIITKSAKIMAQGTKEHPIVFTSSKDAGSRATGDWGGVVIIGNATTNKHDVSTGVGLAEGGIYETYGGTNDADNSGIFQYVRIEFPGIPLLSTANSEINGLTLYSVGSGTTIDHVQVSYSGDDSYEWFGGAVNCKNLVAFRGLDDDFDTDNGFVGHVQFIVGMRDPNKSDQSGSNGFESDNDASGSTLTPTTKPIFSNVTLLGPLAFTSTLPSDHLFKRAMHIRRSSQLCVYNSVFVGYPVGLIIDGELGNSPVKAESDDLQIENCVLAGMTDNFKVSTATSIASPYTVDQLSAYFNATARNNSTASLTDALGSSLLSLTSPNLLPASGSDLLSGASFAATNLSDSYFEEVSFIGAFGDENWTEGWCNWDPQNTEY